MKKLFAKRDDDTFEADTEADDAAVEKKPNKVVVSERKAGVLVHEGKKYAVGLFWLIADEEAAGSLADKRAKKIGADFYCQRSSIVTQQGFGKLSSGHRMGMPSAGAFAADLLVGEWHGVFRADNGWWYLAVHGDAIAPDGDLFFTDEEEAFSHFKLQAENFKWPRTYAPEDWEVQGSTGELPLARLLDQTVPATLKPVSLDAVFAGKRNKYIAMFVSLILVAVFIGVSYLQAVITINLPEPPPILGSSELMMADVKAPPKPRSLDKLVEGQQFSIPLPSAVIAACGDAMSKVVRPLPGWPLDDVVCDGKKIDAYWRQDVGTVELLMGNTGIFPEGTSARIDSNRFIVSLAIENTKKFVQDVRPLSRVNAVLMLNERFNNVGQLQITTVQPSAASRTGLRGLDSQEILPPPPAYLDVLLKTSSSPQVLATYFNVPGLEMKEVRWDFDQGYWSFKAKVNLLNEG